MSAVPAVVPYHVRIRGVYLTLAPLTAGLSLGILCPDIARRHVRALLAGAVLILLATIVPRLRHDLPPAILYPTLLAGMCIAVAFIRLGMLQAGVGWGGRPIDDRILPRWMALFAYGFAWCWLALAITNPRESFPPTRWLLKATGVKISPTASAPAQVHFRRYAVSGRAVVPERGVVSSGEYQFSVGPLVARPGELLVSVSARRADGATFRQPMWLTIDADDPAHPSPMNDLGFYDTASVDGGAPETAALRRSASASRFTQYAWFALTQSLPTVRLRARLWTLDRETSLGDLLFRPVAEADLGTWDLTPLAHLRPQPVR